MHFICSILFFASFFLPWFADENNVQTPIKSIYEGLAHLSRKPMGKNQVYSTIFSTVQSGFLEGGIITKTDVLSKQGTWPWRVIENVWNSPKVSPKYFEILPAIAWILVLLSTGIMFEKLN